jgi:hypothetical protein
VSGVNLSNVMASALPVVPLRHSVATQSERGAARHIFGIVLVVPVGQRHAKAGQAASSPSSAPRAGRCAPHEESDGVPAR